MSAPAPSSSFKTVNVVLRLNICVSAELNADDFKDPRVWQWLCSQAKDVKHGDGEIDISAAEFLNDETIQDNIEGFLEEQSWQHKQEIIDGAIGLAHTNGAIPDSDSDSDSDDELVGHERVTALLLGAAEPSGNSLHKAIADAVKSQ
jgi:hypothetical protein